MRHIMSHMLFSFLLSLLPHRKESESVVPFDYRRVLLLLADAVSPLKARRRNTHSPPKFLNE